MKGDLEKAGRKADHMPFRKYQQYIPLSLPDRKWPDNILKKAPRWCSVDLRDGNQALIEPMNVANKLRLYHILLDIGFCEIEVGFPAASQPDYDFVRYLIDNDLIPEDVSIQVLCQAREALIQRTVDAISGSRHAIFHLYNSTSALQRDIVFRMSRQEIIDLAVKGVEDVKREVQRIDTSVTLQYSPESFTGTELDFAVEICTAVAEAWGATEENKIIINLPATVEMTTPNLYADQIEYFIRHYSKRDESVISLHTHNDRGTGIASTELALMAGASRVEGTLFGNGERTGNCDLVNMALNFFSQGIDPELDLRRLREIRDEVEEINKIPIHVRHPYAGDLVFTAFSGSHQDAIRKGLASMESNADSEKSWNVPYLPIDPSDVGGSYKETVRVNSQSGKGGVGFVLETYYGISLPKAMLSEFSQIIQLLSETEDREVLPEEIWSAFQKAYFCDDAAYKVIKYQMNASGTNRQKCEATIAVSGQTMDISGEGNGPVDAFVNALTASLNEPIKLLSFNEHALSTGEDAEAICYIAIADASGHSCYGAGRSCNTTTAALNAVMSSLNARWKRQ